MKNYYLLLGFVLFQASASIHAQIHQNLSIGSAKALALGNAVTADPPGIDSIHFNPAGLADIKDRQYQIKGIAGTRDIKAEFTAVKGYEEQLAALGFEDPYTNRTSEVESLVVMIPGLGVTEVPVVAGALGGVSYRPPGSRFTLASAAYAPLIGGIKHKPDDPGTFQGRVRAVSRITYFSPSIGYEVNDRLSVGASLGFSYFGVGFNSDMRFPNLLITGLGSISNLLCGSSEIGPCAGEISPTASLANVSGELEDPFSPTFNLGILWDATPWLRLGMVYQSGASDTLKGDVTIDYSPELAAYLSGFRETFDPTILKGILDFANFPSDFNAITTPAEVKFKYPQHFAAGASLQLTPTWKVNMDLKWTEISAWDEWKITFSENVELLEFISLLNLIGIDEIQGNSVTLPRGYKDTWSWALGLEYQYSADLAFRFGYEPRPSAIPDNKRDFMLPLGDTTLFSAGAHYRLDKETEIDVAIGLIRSREFIPNNSSDNANFGGLFNFIYNPYAGQDIETSLKINLFEVSYQKKF